MLGRVLAIAFNTYRESVRARILLGLAGIAFAVAFYSLIVGAYTLKHAPRVVSDLGAASISMFSIAVAVIIGATSLHRELEQKTLFPILARPLGRSEYLLGKYLGTLLTIGVFIMADAGLVLLISSALADRPMELVIGSGLLTVVLLAGAMWKWPRSRTFGLIPWSVAILVLGTVLASGAGEERRVVLGGAMLAFFEVAIVTAIATLFSSFSTPFLSALLTLGIVIIGRSADSLSRFPVKTFGQPMHDFGVFLAHIAPNLHIFVPPRPLLTGEAIDAHLGPYLGMAGLSALAWSVGLLAVASLIFRRRDFL